MNSTLQADSERPAAPGSERLVIARSAGPGQPTIQVELVLPAEAPDSARLRFRELAAQLGEANDV